jgi:hypothetical protein
MRWGIIPDVIFEKFILADTIAQSFIPFQLFDTVLVSVTEQ